jgi:hypothetical protein
MKSKYLIFLLINFIFCIKEYKGEFAWRSIDQTQFSQMDTLLISPQEFYLGREISILEQTKQFGGSINLTKSYI